MNVCSPQLGLSPRSTLGGEVYDCEILQGLAKRGVTVKVIMPKGLQRPPSSKNLQFYQIPISHFPALLFNVMVLPYLFLLNHREKIDILRLHQPQFIFIAAFFFKIFFPSVKIVANFHQFGESNFGLLSKFINNYWDMIVCDSDNVKRKLIEKYHVKSDKVLVVHNGTPAYLKPGRRSSSYANKLKIKDRKVLLYMGRFIPRKNPLFLLEVVFCLKTKFPSLVLLFWGEGPLKRQIIERAEKLGVSDYVRFVPPAFGPVKNLVHNVADIFVHPSLDEGFALAPLEAMACAKPVIMNRSHSSQEAVMDGYNGFLCHTNDSKSWANAIDRLLTDDKKLVLMGKNSREKAMKDFNWGKSVDAHILMFKKLVS